ncbi:MAG: hypothetical protein Q9174_007179 [Haloplaca sp. 1 TL-2023]
MAGLGAGMDISDGWSLFQGLRAETDKSSLEGLLQENGPFLWQYGTFAPVRNPWTWVNLTKEHQQPPMKKKQPPNSSASSRIS